jgi:hypothetical protein
MHHPSSSSTTPSLHHSTAKSTRIPPCYPVDNSKVLRNSLPTHPLSRGKRQINSSWTAAKAITLAWNRYKPSLFFNPFWTIVRSQWLHNRSLEPYNGCSRSEWFWSTVHAPKDVSQRTFPSISIVCCAILLIGSSREGNVSQIIQHLRNWCVVGRVWCQVTDLHSVQSSTMKVSTRLKIYRKFHTACGVSAFSSLSWTYRSFPLLFIQRFLIPRFLSRRVALRCEPSSQLDSQ